MMASETENSADLPVGRSFSVGVAAPGMRGGGRLYIAPQVLICTLGPVLRKITGIENVRHRGNHVDVYRAKLVPFWFNVSVPIDDGRTRVGASTWSFGLRSLTRSLKGAGFDVDLHKTWTFRGLSLDALYRIRTKTNGAEPPPPPGDLPSGP
jgi:hypothetical protein